MVRYAQLVIGPAGSGKSTYCNKLSQHCEIVKRPIHIVNLDPAAEPIEYPVALDIRDLIMLEEVMEDLGLGPNGALLYCMETLEENLDDWLGEELEGYGEEEYMVFDCPGQIELYSHVSAIRGLVDWLKERDWAVCVVYCLDCQFATDMTKLVAGFLQVLSSMFLLELPHVSVFTKVDMMTAASKRLLEEFYVPQVAQLMSNLQTNMSPRFVDLTRAISNLIDDCAMVSLTPLDYSDEDSIAYLLSQIDHSIQFGEDAETRMRDLEIDDEGPEDEGNKGICGL